MNNALKEKDTEKKMIYLKEGEIKEIIQTGIELKKEYSV